MSSPSARPHVVPDLVEAHAGAAGFRLPAAPTPLIGREHELAAVQAMLERGARLVTLTGPGGVGKTRLSLEIARHHVADFTDGATFVSLAPIRDPALVAESILQALEGQETSGQTPLDALRERLRDDHVLLVLDNLEHLLAATPLLSELLAGCPRLAVIATSRVRLDLSGEHAYPVPPLAVPGATVRPTVENLSGFAAIQLFVARARAVVPTFALTEANAASIGEVCRRVDGLPLAIELAAARSRVLSPPALLARLTNRLSLLTGGPRDAPERLRTMRDAISWSHDLLPPERQVLFRRLAVFVGGFTLEAAEGVTSVQDDPEGDVLENLEALLDASLVRRLEQTSVLEEARFGMLETIAEYGLELLADTGEEVMAREAHADLFLALAERAEPELLGVDQEPWFTRLEVERPNLRAALAWLRHRGNAERALRLAGALGLFWTWPPYIREGREWLEAVLALPDAAAFPALHAKALNAAGILAEWQADFAQAREVLEQARAIRERLGDRVGVAEVLGSLGNVALGMGDLNGAEQTLTECVALYRELDQPFWEAETLASLGSVAVARGDHRRAVERYEASVACWRSQSGPTKVSDALILLGWSYFLLGDRSRSQAAYTEGLALEVAAGDYLRIGRCLRGAAGHAAAAGDPAWAARLLALDAAVQDELGVPLRAATRKELDRLIQDVRAALGAEAFAQAWDSGRDQSILEAAEVAASIFAGQRPVVDEPAETPADSQNRALAGVVPGLTAREHVVLRLLIAGRSDKEIADRLFITRRTASNHVSAIRAKLGVRSRAAAVAAILDRLDPSNE